MNDPDHVYTTATYFNASYNNPSNGNAAFARTCYGHVAGAPPSTVASVSDDNAQTMTPPYGYTKLGGKPGIAILKQLFRLNKQIVALTDELKIASPLPTKEGFAQKSDAANNDANNDNDADNDADNDTDRIASISKQIRMDSIKLNETIARDEQLNTDEMKSQQALLYSRVKFGVAVVLGLLLGYLAYRFLTADSELPEAIRNEIGAGDAATTTTTTTTTAPVDAGMDSSMDAGMDSSMDSSMDSTN
jgi:hypothetical protein